MTTRTEQKSTIMDPGVQMFNFTPTLFKMVKLRRLKKKREGARVLLAFDKHASLSFRFMGDPV